MAKAKKKAKAKSKRSELIGHNSDHAEQQAEILKIANLQRKLDKEKRTAQAEWKERHSALTGRLKEVGVSRQAFQQPYQNFLRLAEAENDDDARKARDDNKLYLAQQRIAYDALGHGQTIDWIDLIQDADEIAKTREQAERDAAEEAAESADEPEETAAAV